jgi:hypothetical protein
MPGKGDGIVNTSKLSLSRLFSLQQILQQLWGTLYQVPLQKGYNCLCQV